jgi:hypothetical protein
MEGECAVTIRVYLKAETPVTENERATSVALIPNAPAFPVKSDAGLYYLTQESLLQPLPTHLHDHVAYVTSREYVCAGNFPRMAAGMYVQGDLSAEVSVNSGGVAELFVRGLHKGMAAFAAQIKSGSIRPEYAYDGKDATADK